MRLHRIALTDVGGVERSELVVPTDGVSVVLAPNETGKSTLLRAYRLLLDKAGHTSRTKDIRALQPVGRDVGSTVEAELTIGDETFEVSRTYNKDVASQVTVRGARTLERSGKEADELLRTRFLEAVDQDLFELLHLAQGRALDALAVADSDTVLGALQAEDGATGAGQAGGDALLDALRARVGRAFHARNGTLIGELRKLEQRVLDAEARRDELADRVENLADDGGTGDASQVAEIETALKELAQRIVRADAAAKATTARKLLEAATERARQRQTQVADVERLLAEEKGLTEQVDALKKDREATAAEVTRLQKAAEGAQAQLATLHATAAQAEADLLAALATEVATLRKRIAGERVDAELVTRARALDRAVEVARAGLESGAWELVARAGGTLSLEVDGEQVMLAEGEELTRAVSSSFVLRGDDGTVLDVHADADRRAGMEELTEATAALTALLGEVEADDLAALEERLEGRVTTERLLEALASELEELEDDPVADDLPGARNGDGADLDALRAAHEDALDALAEHGDGESSVLVEARATLAQHDQVIEMRSEELSRSTERREAAEQALSAARAEGSDEALGDAVLEAKAALEALGDVDETADAESLRVQEKALTEQLDEAKRLAHLAEGRRSSTGALTATLTTLRETADTLRAELDRDVREAEAARTLLGRLDDARAEQGDRYSEPLEQRIGELLTRLYGYDCRVEVDDDLRIALRSDPDGRMIPFEQLSGGAKEQAAVVTGLAIAELAGDGGVPLWIDDAIVFTDDDRVEGLKALLAEATAQVIVLTCRSELAEGLPAATFTTGDG